MTPMSRYIVLAAGILFSPNVGFGQTPPPGGVAQAEQARPAPPIDDVVLALLIKSTIIAVQQANATGNYSVLRDLGTPIFRERYDQASLTAIFANLRAGGINLSPALMLMPQLLKKPEITSRGQLHLVGNFPTQPLQIRFDLLFLQLDGIWRIDGIAVSAGPPGNDQVMSNAKGTESRTDLVQTGTAPKTSKKK